MTTPAGDDLAGSARLVVTLDDTSVDGEARRLGDRIEDILARAARDAGLRMQRSIQRAIRAIDPQRIRVEADLRGFQRSLNDLNNLGSAPVRVVPDVDRAQFEAAIEAALAGLEVLVRVIPDLDDFDARIRAHNAPDVNLNVNADVDRGLSRSLNALGGALGGIGQAATGALRLGAVGIAAASAAQGVFALSAALAPAAGALAALPAVIAGAVAANAALKLALQGVGDAFSAALTGDAEKFEETLKNLSPAAQAAAREVRALKPAFEDLRSSVQDEFFSQFEGQITKVAEALDGPLKKGLTLISNEFGRAAASALDYLSSASAVGNVTNILAGTQGALSGLSTAAQPVVKGFLDIAAAVADAFGPKIGQGIAQAGAEFGTFLSTAAASGRAVEWVENAVTVFKQLGAIASNVGHIISGVFRAANDVGGGLLNNLKEITGQFRDFVESAQGQEAVGNLFGAIASIAAQLGPILSALVTQVGAIAPALVPVFESLGPAVVGVINTLGPAIQALLPGVQAVVSGLVSALDRISASGALTALGTALSQVGTALASLLPLAGELVASLAGALAPAVGALAQALGPVVQALAVALIPVLPPLVAAFQQMFTTLSPLAATLGQVGAALIQQLSPYLTQISTTLATQLVPALTRFGEQIFPLASRLLELAGPVLQFSAALTGWTIINVIIPMITDIVNAMTTFAGILTTVVGQVATFVDQVIAPFQRLYDTLVGNSIIPDLINQTVAWFAQLPGRVLGIVSGLVSSVVGYFAGLPSRARSALAPVIGNLTSVFNQAKSAVISRVTSLVSDAVDLVRSLPGRARDALGNLGGYLVRAGASLIQGFIDGIRSKLNAAKNAVSDVVGAVRDFFPFSPAKEGPFSGRGWVLYSGRAIGDSLAQGIADRARVAVRAAERLARDVAAPTAGLRLGADVQVPSGARSALRASSVLADPFGGVGAPRIGGRFSGSAASGSGGGRTTNSTSTRTVTNNNTFNLTEVGDAGVTAQRVLNRLVLAASGI